MHYRWHLSLKLLYTNLNLQCTKKHSVDLRCHGQILKQYYVGRHLSYLIGVGISRCQTLTLTLGTSLIDLYIWSLKLGQWALSLNAKWIKEYDPMISFFPIATMDKEITWWLTCPQLYIIEGRIKNRHELVFVVSCTFFKTLRGIV